MKKQVFRRFLTAQSFIINSIVEKSLNLREKSLNLKQKSLNLREKSLNLKQILQNPS